ncbi:TetR/AcrR family transcriptional regulator [Methylomonas sp. UP202]|uniref:TetR/AcrR family transcriptional regulator n=1 Tax=Methylomonas sp. UP202 TaxID=3040943 RepID=UPI002478FA7D|nr:TetR/AcrR family transcriptional regulator [Methylomonas sp. UP202]WGS83968.1 TetR/AcrR family transcriptional regulator [Methylomonas sp. UP202]
MAKQLQERILQAASELFYSQGIKATGVEAIVKMAGTNKMTLYNYFPSKDDLVVAFLRKRDEEFRSWLVGRVNDKASEPKHKLLAIFDVIGEWLDIPEFRGCAFINAAAEFPLEGNPVHQVSTEFYDNFRCYMSDLAKQCGITSADSLALQLSLLVEGAIVSEQMKRHSCVVEQAKLAARILIESHIGNK